MSRRAAEIPGLLSADYDGYSESVKRAGDRYRLHPRLVSIETLVKCNARCGFCPYPLSSRIGERLDTDVVIKILRDLEDIPKSHKFNISLSRINEPLLDDRLEAFHRIIKEKLPNAYPQFWSNGTTLRPGRFEWMGMFPGSMLAISLNSVDEDEHTRMMGFGLKAVLPNLDYLHSLLEGKKLSLNVALRAPFENRSQAAEFMAYTAKRWPRFSAGLRPYFVWEGDVGAGKIEQERAASGLPEQKSAAHFACGQWYDLHILANGYATKCCIDEAGFKGQEKFDCSKRHVLDIYRENQPLRDELPSRENVDGCEGCLHLG